MKKLSLIFLLVFVLYALLPTPGQSAKEKATVGILVFDDVQVIDYTGPYEVFMAAGFKVVLIAPEKKMITTIGSMKIMPDYDFTDSPKLDILVVPGGGRSTTNPDLQGVWKNAPLPIKDSPETISWVTENAERARFVLSVCNGAFTLARAGLLENKSAVTTLPFLEKLKQVSPTTTVVSDKRWTDNGKIVSSGGLSAGIDAALHVVEKMNGRGNAQGVALGLEYNWDADGSYSAFSLARKYTMFGFEIEGQILKREGDENHWENSWLVSKPNTIAEIMEAANKPLSDSEKTMFGPVKVKWEWQSFVSNPNNDVTLWRFADENGTPWVGMTRVEPSPTEKDKFIFSIRVARRDSSFARLFQ